MLNSSGNPIHKILILITTSAIGIGFYFLMSNSKIQIKNSSEPNQEKNTVNPTIPKNLNTIDSPALSNIPESSIAPTQKQPTASPEPTDYFEAAKSTDRDQKHFQEITRKTNIQIQKQMRQEEIVSLKESIKNDQALLKKIEESGSGIEDYKYIEQNLKKRIQRLRQLGATSTTTDKN